MLDAIRLENCAVWNMDCVDEHERAAERHDMQAFRLFRAAHELRTLGWPVAA